MNRLDEAKVRKAKLDCQALAQQAEIYQAINGVFPPSIQVLTQPQPGGEGPLVAPDRIKDLWGRTYQLRIVEDGNMRRPVVFTNYNGQEISSLDRN